MTVIDRIKKLFRPRQTSSTGSLLGGGVVNNKTGMGTSLDNSESMLFTPTRWYWQTPLEVLCRESFLARHAVRMPPRDMFLRRRVFTGSNAERFQQELDRVRVDDSILDGLIAARQYGSGLVVLMTSEAPLTEPFNMNRIRSGDLRALRVFNRFDASVFQREADLMSPDYGQPLFYDVHPRLDSRPFRVHSSRVIRFDGIKEAGDSRATVYDYDWGTSVLIPIVTSILQEAGLAQATAHLVHEASIPVLHVEGLREAMAGMGGDDEVSAQQIGSGINEMKSMFRIMMLDKGAEEFSRVGVNFGGLGDISDRVARRVSAATEIPMTRLWGTSPMGLNATGEGDMRQYVMSLEAERENLLRAPYRFLDEVVARSAGITEIPEAEWPSLIVQSDEEMATTALTRANALNVAANAGALDEDEFRAAINGQPVFGDLAGTAPGLPEPDLPPMPNEMDI